jgi:hypothetical protein
MMLLNVTPTLPPIFVLFWQRYKWQELPNGNNKSRACP